MHRFLSKLEVPGVVALLIAISFSSPSQAASVQEENKALVRKYLEEVVSRGNMVVADQLVASNVVFTSPYTPQPIRDLAGFKQMITMLHASFPDLRIHEEDLIAEGDKVVSRWVARGTQQGEFMGFSSTGKQFAITGISIYRIADGKIVEGWVNDDSLGMMQQLGIIPQPGQAGK